MLEKMGVPLSLVDRSPRIGDQTGVSDVLLEGFVQSADRTRTADPGKGDDVAVIGDAEASLLHPTRLLIHLPIGNSASPTRAEESPHEAARLAKPIQLQGELTSDDQLATMLEEPVQDRREVRLPRASKHPRGEIRVHDHAHGLRSPGIFSLLPR